MVVEKGCSINNETPKDRIASCWAYTISHNDPQYQLPWQIKTEMQVHPAKAPIVANWGQAGPRPIQSLTAHLNELEKAFVHHDYNECHIITRRVTAGYRGRTDDTVLECLFQLRCHNQSFLGWRFAVSHQRSSARIVFQLKRALNLSNNFLTNKI